MILFMAGLNPVSGDVDNDGGDGGDGEDGDSDL